MICGIDFPCHQCSHHCPLHPLSTTAANPAIRCRCGAAFPAAPLLLAFWTGLPLYPPSTTAANPAIRCRCGAAFPAAPLLLAFWTGLPLHPLSTTAANPAIRCRCGAALVPLRCRVSRRTTATCSLDGIASPSSFHNGSKSCDSVPLWCHIPAHPCTCPCHRLTHLPKVRRISRIFRHLPNVGNTWIFSGG